MPSKAVVVGKVVIPLILLGVCGMYFGSKLSSAISYSMVDPFIQGSITQGFISPSTALSMIGILSVVVGFLLFIIGMRRLTRSYYNWVTAGMFFISMALLALGLHSLSNAAILAPLALN